MTIAATANNPGITKAKKKYAKTEKAAILAAVEKSGGSLFLQVHGPTISVSNPQGTGYQQYNGHGTVHELTYEDIQSDKISPVLVGSMVAYLEAVETGSNDFEMVYRPGTQERMKKFDIYTKDSVVEAYRAGLVKGELPPRAMKMSFK